MHKRLVMIALVVALLAHRSGGQPRLIPPGDPEGREIRDAAAAFLTALATGDRTRARGVFSGDATQARLLDLYERWVDVAETFSARMRGRFGEREEASMYSAKLLLTLRVAQLETKFLMRNDGDALVASGSFLEEGLTMRRAGGAWKVSSLCNDIRRLPALRDLLEGLISALQRATLEVDAADQTLAGVLAGLNTQTDTVVDRWLMRGLPTTVRSIEAELPPRSTGEPPSLTLIRATMNKPLDSAEVAQLIASMPGLPRLSATKDAIFVASPESGISLNFDGHDGKLRVAFLAAEGNEGQRGYRGEWPCGLSVTDTRLQVEQKLGPAPSSSGDARVGGYSARYPEQGILVDYWSRGLRDPNAQIACVAIFGVERPPATTLPFRRSAPPHLAFRLVIEDRALHADAAAEALADPATNQPILVAREELLADADVASVSRDLREKLIYLDMTVEGARRLEKVTMANMGRRMAIVLDDKVVIAPTIREAIKGAVTLNVGSNATDEEVRVLAGQLHAAINRLRPASEPSRSD